MRTQMRRVIGNTLAALHGPTVESSTAWDRLDARRDQIESIGNVVVRDTALVVHDLTVDNPVKAEKWRRRLGGKPADFVGAGDFAAVYTVPAAPNHVKKMYRRFADNPALHIGMLESKMNYAEQLFSGVALATSLAIETDPFTEIKMPVGTQKFCTYGPNDVAFPDLETRDQLGAYYESLEQRHSGSARAILAFCVQAQETWIKRGVLPDIVRPENMVVGSVDGAPAQLHLIDTVPHFMAEPQHAQSHASILHKLDMATISI